MHCENCGAEVDPRATFCRICGYQINAVATATVIDPAPIAEPSGNATATVIDQAPMVEFSANGSLNLIPGTPIALGDGESVWREYAVTRLKRREQGEGKLYVTDSRVIFLAKARGRGSGRASTLIQETKLEHITGLSAYVSRKVSLLWFATTVILGLAALLQLVRGSTTSFIVLALLTAGAVYSLIRGAAQRGSFGVSIHAASSQASPIVFGLADDSGSGGPLRSTLRNFVGSLFGLLGAPTAFDVLEGIPAEDAERVISELGALIIDLQSKGSLASGRWGMNVG